jgi:hypothetical protein
MNESLVQKIVFVTVLWKIYNLQNDLMVFYMKQNGYISQIMSNKRQKETFGGLKARTVITL